jgi:hypothetical protein
MSWTEEVPPRPDMAVARPHVSSLAIAGLIVVFAATAAALPGWSYMVRSAPFPWPEWVMNLLRVSVPLGIAAGVLLFFGDNEIRRSNGRLLKPPLLSLGEVLAVLGFVLSFFTWLLVIGASASNLTGS